jgi:hypothetical protein
MLNQIGGVNASLLKGIYDAGNLIGEGEYERGFETVAPAAVRSLAAAARLAGEGAKTIGGGQMVTKSGQPIDVTIGTVLRRGLGFNDREIAEYQGRHRNLKEDAAQYNDAITATKRDYVKAVDKMINAKTPELRKEYQERAIKAAQQWVRVHAKNRVPFTFGEAKDFVNSYTAGKLAGMWDVDGVKGSLMREAFLREHHDANEWDNFWANPKKEGGED